MAEETKNEGVYGENVDGATSVSGIREETVRAHPNMTGDEAEAAREEFGQGSADGSQREDVDSARDMVSRGTVPSGEAADAAHGTVADDLENVRAGQAAETGSGGMGRDGVPRNEGDAPQGVYGRNEDEEATTPG